jgi:hypothetical protein
MHIRHIAENITHPIVGTITAKSIPKPMQKAQNPISLFFLKKLKILPPYFLLGKNIINNLYI